MNINTRDLGFVKFNGQEMSFVNYNGQTIYEAWKELVLNGASPLALPKCKGGTKLLPDEYQEVEYIEGTGAQYIDIKYQYKKNDEININFMKTGDTGAIQGVFGNGNLPSYTGTVLYINATNILTVTIGGVLGTNFYKYETEPIQNNRVYNVKFAQKNVYLDNKQIITVANELSDGTQEDFSLFRRWGTNTLCGRIYKFDIQRGGKFIFNLIPCYRKTDNVIGMYDLVNKTFYTNAGTEEFVKGDDIHRTVKLLDYKIFGNSISKSRLPQEYQEVEYIQTTGTQHIDSGVPLKNGLKIVVDWIYQDADSGNNYTGGHIGSPGNRWLIGSQRQKNYFFAVGSGNVNTEFTFGNRDVIEAYWEDKNSYFMCNGVKSTKYNYQMYTLTEEPTYTYYMGAVNRDGNATLKPKLTIYSWKFYQDDVLIRDYVPCYRKSDNIAGLYDLVEGKFYTNDGTGELVKGNITPIEVESVGNIALPSDYQQVDYIENTGTQYIDTKIADSTNTKIALDFTYMGVSNPGGSNYMGSNGGNLIAVNSNYKFAMGGYASDITPIENERYTIILNRDSEEIRTLQINNSEEYVGSKASQNNNIYLFALGGSPASGKILAKLHSCKIYKDGVLICNILPCYRKSDNVVGMYDMISDVFHTNAGTGEFIKGDDINTYKISVTARGKNRLNLPISTTTHRDVVCNISDNNTVKFEGISTQYPIFTYNALSIPANTTVRMSYNGTNAEKVEFRLINSTTNEKLVIGTKSSQTPTFDVDKFQIALSPNYDYSDTVISNIQIEIGKTSTDYEPYIEPAMINIYLNAPLRKNEDYVDYTDYKNQKICRNITNTVFDGTEAWELHTAITGGNVFRLDNVLNPLMNAPLSATYMSHFGLTNIYSTAGFSTGVYRLSSNQEGAKITGNRLYVSTSHTTLEEFKVWLSENKPILSYPIETVEEPTNIPDIIMNKGTNIIEVNTTIQPSNMEVTYWGKK